MESKNLLAVSFDDESGKYKIDIPAGSNVAESMFCIAVVIKCFVRDGYVKTTKEAIDMIKKYLNDPQYDEVEEVSDDKV